MGEYNALADLLNKYSQLTPWVQALIGLGAFGAILGIAYFFKETVAVMMRPFMRDGAATEPKKEWRDVYYRAQAAGQYSDLRRRKFFPYSPRFAR